MCFLKFDLPPSILNHCSNILQGLNSDLKVSKDEETQCSKYILQKLLPHLKEINDEQVLEMEFEANILGTFLAFNNAEK